jgi:hypothetical protein
VAGLNLRHVGNGPANVCWLAKRERRLLYALLIGGITSLLNIVVHAVATAVLTHAVGTRIAATLHRHAIVRLSIIIVIAATVLMVAHLVEIAVWGSLYAMLGVTPEGSSNFVFAFVNYTTLGYGDIVPVPSKEVLGPMTAMNGVLLFGWSTALLFQVLSVTVSQQHSGFPKSRHEG